jgi:FRG domain
VKVEIANHNFSSWGDFKSGLPLVFGGKIPIMKRYVFRGQADASWPLESSFDRAYRGSPARRAKEYKKYLDFFRTLNRRLGRPMPESDDEAGALAQHYGMPTRLLDWSLSPYAAAFFAFYYAKINKVSSTHVAIWAIDRMQLIECSDPRHFEMIRSKSAENARINRQLGCFIAARGQYSNFGEYLEQRPAQASPLHRCIIPRAEFMDDALNDLILMGQTPVDIYPDFEGVAMYVKLRMAFEGYAI